MHLYSLALYRATVMGDLSSADSAETVANLKLTKPIACTTSDNLDNNFRTFKSIVTNLVLFYVM